MLSYRSLFSLIVGLALATSAQTQPQAPPASPSPRGAASASARADSSEPIEESRLYRNTTVGFRYRIPFGWVNRTREMQEPPAEAQLDVPDATSSPSNPKSPKHAASAGAVLLAIFERPPDAPGDSINSAVLIASESAATYPGLKKAVDYLEPLNELTVAKGFKPTGDPSLQRINGRELVRADFSRAVTDKLTMYQSTLVMLAKGQIVSFTFVAGSEQEVDELIEGLAFAAR